MISGSLDLERATEDEAYLRRVRAMLRDEDWQRIEAEAEAIAARQERSLAGFERVSGGRSTQVPATLASEDSLV